MKPGSLIEYLGGAANYKHDWTPGQTPVKGEIYTLREIISVKNSVYGIIRGVMVEEMCFGYSRNGLELAIDIRLWREIQTPPSLKDEIEKALTAPIKHRELVEA